MTETIQVTINERGKCDWECLRAHAVQAREIVSLFSTYVQNELTASKVSTLGAACPVAWEESIEVAKIIGVKPVDVFAANVYYDTVRYHCGCTAFAIDHVSGPLHGHCLDWETESEILSKNAMIFRFVNTTGKTILISMGWPGFLGVLVGVAPGRFAVSLNAVWSDEAPGRGEPIGFALRNILATTTSFDQVVGLLSKLPLSCDCLLLASGAKQGELVVIERTPSRSAVRRADVEKVLVTNHYCSIDAGSNKPGYISTGQEPFGIGSRERYEEALTRLSKDPPHNLDLCFSLLDETPFRQENTIQRVAMRAATSQFIAAPVMTHGDPIAGSMYWKSHS